MKRTFLSCFVVLVSLHVFSQKEVLLQFEKERIGYTKKAMLVLGSWSAANIVGSAFATNTSNREMRYFHQMNVMWNGVNLFLAGLGYIGAGKEKNSNLPFSGVLKRQSTSEKTFLFNTALDLAYVAGGLYMKERSKSRGNPAQLEGYGNSVMLQGGFLFVFDAINYTIHRKHGRQLHKIVDKLEIVGVPGGVSFTYKL